MKRPGSLPPSGLLCLVLLACGSARALADENYYKERPLFSTAPNPTKSLANVGRFGPVGLSIDLIQPAFTMRIAKVEEGSPAAEAGLTKGQIVESINGESLKDIDPRIQLADILGKAEASDGKLSFKIKDLADPVVATVPVLGAYSESWPVDCEKSDRIIRQMADYLKSEGANLGIADIGMTFLLSTGDKSDLEFVGEWARSAKPQTYAWYLGFGGVPLCEYYLRTGDPQVRENIQQWVDNAVAGQYLNGWAGRGGVPSVTYGGGHLNAAGTSVVTFLLLAKECGADVPDRALLGALRHFYRYAGRGGNPYGDGRPELGFVDNGKNGNLAFAMAAAAALTPDGEESLYAMARDYCAMQSFYTTTFMLHGHTGGGIGEIWRSAAMGLLRDKKPAQYREFMDRRRWHYELSRRFDGSMGILGGGGYDKEQWGVAYGWAYTLPRKQLRIFGAPPTKYSKSYQLPKQPWGNEADNEFLSLQPVPGPDGRVADLSGETLAEDSAIGFLRKIHGEEVSDELIRRYIRHPEAVIRQTAASKALGINRGYIGWRSPGGGVRPALVMEFLRSDSARVRRAMFSSVAETLHRGDQQGVMNREIFDLALAAVNDPKESLWVKDACLHVIGHADPDWLVPHVDLVVSFLTHEEPWLRNAALHALTSVAADERTYRKVLPAIAELIRTNQRASVTLGLLGSIRAAIREAGEEVQKLAVQELRESYTGYTGVATAPGGQDISSTLDAHLEHIAASLAEVPGGLDVLYEITRERYPNEILPYRQFFLNADPSGFGPKLRQAIKPIIDEELIPEYVGRNRKRLLPLAALEVQNSQCGGANDVIDGLVGLHARAGRDEFGWRMFLDLNEAEWSYHSFDPIPAEQVPYDQLITRYREVTLPSGMEDWVAPDFEPAKAGWKVGKAPFGNYGGKIPQGPVSKCSSRCDGGECHGALRINTLWEKEVLLMRGTFKVPELKDGHRYRLRVNHRAHVGNGGGFAVYLNGRLLIEKDQCIGRGGGEKPYGAFITGEWLEELSGREVTIAVKSFLRYNDKYKVKPTEKLPQGRISVHLDEQKLPPLGDELVRQSARVVPMTCWKWQQAHFSESDEVNPDDSLFRWDGKFRPNTAVSGSWQLVAEVPEIAEFDPERPKRARRAPFSQISLGAGGTTNHPTWLWSGDRLMDLERYEALRMEGKTLDGTDYLFVEAGGFSNRHKPEWTPAWYVLERK